MAQVDDGAMDAAVKQWILDEAERLRAFWPEISEGIPAWHPRNEGDDDGSSDDDAADGSGDDSGSDDSADNTDDADDSGDDKGGPDWKSMARKHERRAKQERKEREALAARLKEFEDRDKSESEKAIAKAREEAAAEVASKYEAERRQDRLELATTRLATKGVKVGDDTVKFADPDDALAHLEREIKRGNIDGDDIFGEDGKVNRDALSEALAELLEDKPHLAARDSKADDDDGQKRKRAGDADTGKGKGAGKSLEDASVEDHFKRIRRSA